jgi:hypothetical protein
LASGPLSAARSHRKRCTSHRHRLFITRHLHRFTSRHLSMSRQHPSTLDRGITGIGIEVIDARASNLSSVSTRPSSRGAGIPSTGRAMSCCDQLSALPQLRSAVPRQALELSPSHLLNLTAVWPRSGSSSHSRLLGISFLPILGVKSKERAIMKSCVSTIGLGIAVFAFFGFQPAEAGCQLIHATHSAPSQAKAVETSQALALRSDPLVPRLGAGLWILIHGCARTAHPPFNSVSWLARFPAAYVLYQQQV